jgi:hypothetical protein
MQGGDILYALTKYGKIGDITKSLLTLNLKKKTLHGVVFIPDTMLFKFQVSMI